MSFASEYPRPGSLGSWSNRELQWIKFTVTNLWGISVRVREKEPPAGGHSPPRQRQGLVNRTGGSLAPLCGGGLRVVLRLCKWVQQSSQIRR